MKPLKWKTLGDFKAERKRRRTPAALAKNEECCGPLNLVKSDRRGRRAIKPEVGINDNSFRVIQGNNHMPGGERERERERWDLKPNVHSVVSAWEEQKSSIFVYVCACHDLYTRSS
jgi:hypothetical protein